MTNSNAAIADIQSRHDSRNIAINQVGVKAVKHPLALKQADGQIQHSIADFTMTVALPSDVKGTHMSRFLALLNEENQAIPLTGFAHLLDNMLTRLNATEGKLSAHFPYFIAKVAPVSKVSSLMDYQVTLSAEIKAQTLINTLSIIVPITSLCPCSKEISAYGAHNQRSHITATVEFDCQDAVSIEELVQLIEKQASSELYGLLKRSDEKYVTERAYENPKFVEDLVRDIALVLQENQKISRFRLESENFESIHNHSAYALIES